MRRWFAFGVLAVVSCSELSPSVPETLAPAPLRRLTNSEYATSLNDLFPGVEVTVSLPDDFTVAGFDNQAEAQAPTDVRVARYESIAWALASRLTQDSAAVRRLTGCESWNDTASASQCAETFIEAVGTRAFRRPLEQSEKERLLTRFRSWENATDFEGAVRLTLAALLQSPQFLYRVEHGEPQLSGYEIAARLSFLLWQSVPDDTLRAAAERGDLDSGQGIRSQAERMLGDERAKRMWWNFHRQWLGLERMLSDEHAVRTAEVDAEWTSATRAAAYLEARRFVENVLHENASLHELFVSRRAWLDAETARLYRVPETSVELPMAERAGILTRIGFLAGHAHRGTTSPPVRGNAVLLRLLCNPAGSPPANVDLSPPLPAAGEIETTRTLFERRTSPSSCIGCHRSLDGVGFAFEHYGAAGAFRLQERGLVVDSSGSVEGTAINGAIELSEELAHSEAVADCFVQNWVRYASGRSATVDESDLVSELGAELARTGNLRDLILHWVTSDAFRFRAPPNGDTP